MKQLSVKIVRKLKNPDAIATECECSVASVYRFAKANGIDFKLLKMLDEMDERLLVRTMRVHLKDVEIAQKLAVSPQYINQLR